MHQERQSNRLINEKSPYLRQHAWNPVDWYPWGQEAFEAARQTDRPIFLSIGYSTCHWCHVMERESFEDDWTAAILNSSFIPVKVDREEMPDLDRIYMLFVRATTGSGGWPMSVWLTPALKPFFGGSYFPPVPRRGRPAFREILGTIDHMWRDDRARIEESAGSMMRRLIALSRQPEPSEHGHEVSERCFEQLERSFDPVHGGFGSAPKFPRPALLRFLFAHAGRTGNRKAQEMALHTIDRMAAGGIHDHLAIPGIGGGGFARYSTDETWHLPHFEKMLYDNAQLADAALRAFQATRARRYAELARDIFSYVISDMRSPDGAFYAAEDADSIPPKGGEATREGAFYLWSRAEVMQRLGAEDGALFCRAYGVEEEGNILSDPHGEFSGMNVLKQAETPALIAEATGIGQKAAEQRLDRARTILFEARRLRPRPRRDEKVVCAWNGLMISALARGSSLLGEPSLLEKAEQAAAFVMEHLYDRERGRLMRSWCDGESKIPGKAADYACMVQALLDLYEASFKPEHLEIALKLAETQTVLFHDPSEGGFFSTATDDGLVPLRMKEDDDGAEPSAGSVSAMNLLRLAAMTGRDNLRELAMGTLRCFSGTLERTPTTLPLMLVALDTALEPQTQVILAGAPDDPQAELLRRSAALCGKDGMVLMQASGAPPELLPEAAATAASWEGPPAALVCSKGSCHPPAYEPEALEKLLAD
jgi:uncharacterized protein YyaL (SSP411 family)